MKYCRNTSQYDVLATKLNFWVLKDYNATSRIDWGPIVTYSTIRSMICVLFCSYLAWQLCFTLTDVLVRYVENRVWCSGYYKHFSENFVLWIFCRWWIYQISNIMRPSTDTKVTCNGLKYIHSLKNTGNHYACLDLLMSRTNKDKIFLKTRCP